MAHSRMAISALLSDSPSAAVTARRTSPPMGSPSSSASVARARSPGLQPLQLSLPLTLVRRTPSPPASARPGKRPRSEASPSSRSVRPRLAESASSSSSSSRSTGTATPSTSSSASASATGNGRASYSNPGFYSIGSGPAAPPRQETPPPPRLADALEPMPLATFASTTNAELRWAESRPSSRAASPAVAELPHGPASTDSALAAGVKFVEDVRASLIGSRTRRASTDQSSRLAYPSSSERDRPLGGHARRRSGSGATSNASGSSDARSPTSSSSRDAHDWLIDHYSSRSPASRPRQPINQRPQNSPRPSPMMASVDDELLDLVDGPPQQQRESAIVRVKPEEDPHTLSVSEDLDLPSEQRSEASRTKPIVKRTKPGAGAKRNKHAASSRSRSVSLAVDTEEADSPAPGMDIDEDIAAALGLSLESHGKSSRRGSATPGGGSPSKRRGGGPKGAAAAAAAVEEKLYCVCQAPYDEGRVMIACDKCDDWYHTACVDVAESELELIDQFVCPVCQAADGRVSTSYKARCMRGQWALAHPTPKEEQADGEDDLPVVCPRPARLPMSKYCSDACGRAHVKARIAAYGNTRAKGSSGGSGGERWEVEAWNEVRGAARVEGVTIALAADEDKKIKPKSKDDAMDVVPTPCDKKPTTATTLVGHHQSPTTAQLAQLQQVLDQLAAQRDTVQTSLALVRAREALIARAAARADAREQCGWDERLLMGDVEWAAWVAGGGGDQEDEADEEQGWWCSGKKKCDRHAGWLKLRLAEVEVERMVKNDLLEKLTTRERMIRRCMEDIEPPALVVPPATSNVNGRGRGGGGGGGPRRR